MSKFVHSLPSHLERSTHILRASNSYAYPHDRGPLRHMDIRPLEASSRDSRDSRDSFYFHFSPQLKLNEAHPQWTTVPDHSALYFPRSGYHLTSTSLVNTEDFIPCEFAPFDDYQSSYISTYRATRSLLDHTPRCHTDYSRLISTDGLEDLDEGYPPSVYHLDSTKANGFDSTAGRYYADEYGMRDGNADANLYQSDSKNRRLRSQSLVRFDQTSKLRQSEIPEDQNNVHAANVIGKRDRSETCHSDKEQPYAQLIFRALMDVPGHTMILRDIYNWFRLNTDKVTGETKGWQNSIRHNLSMNGAFEKVDQPPGDSDVKKGFMWRLTEEAIREGVKSTTRYRSKLPSKRGGRPHGQLPSRQAWSARSAPAIKRPSRIRRAKDSQDDQNLLDSQHSPGIAAISSIRPDTADDSSFETSCIGPYFLSTGTELDKEGPVSLLLSQTTTPLSDRSFPTSPESISSEAVYLLPSSMNEPLFYDSPGPGLETNPGTPDALPEHARSFIDTKVLM